MFIGYDAYCKIYHNVVPVKLSDKNLLSARSLSELDILLE